MVAQEQGSFAQADELYRESLALHQEAKDARGIAAVLANWGTLMNDQGHARRAEDLFRESFSILKDLGQRDDIIECLEGIAGVAILLQQPRRAARLFGAAQALREMIGAPAPPYKIPRHKRFLESVEAQLDRITMESELLIGKKMSLNEAMEYALNEGAG